jgi:hypothetical protein
MKSLFLAAHGRNLGLLGAILQSHDEDGLECTPENVPMLRESSHLTYCWKLEPMISLKMLSLLLAMIYLN